MKSYIKLFALFAGLLVLIPALAFYFGKGESAAPADAPVRISDAESVKMLDTETGAVTELSMRDYLIGSVFAQMPAEFEPEALKAQAVLAHTYILKRRLQEQASPDATLSGADFSTDSTRYQAFFTESYAKEFYGDSYAANFDKIAAAVDAVPGKICTYDGALITVAFHAISCGVTESAAYAWGIQIPYLVSVDSASDTTVTGCTKTVSFTAEEVKARLTQGFDHLTFSGEPAHWLEIAEKSPAGTVLTVAAGDSKTPLNANAFAVCLNLPSQHFSVAYADEKFTFTVMGSGHQVGMSQYGAEAMAQQGDDFQKILTHYFTGITVADATD
ncbi:MAG: stage II sporulation protein D [Oscillospiraceae bacterium]